MQHVLRVQILNNQDLLPNYAGAREREEPSCHLFNIVTEEGGQGLLGVLWPTGDRRASSTRSMGGSVERGEQLLYVKVELVIVFLEIRIKDVIEKISMV